MEVSHVVAARLRDHHRVQLAAVTAPTQTAYPRTIHWQPTSLAQGDAGMALICGYLDACFPDQDWDRIGHRRYLTAAAQGAEQAPFQSSGLFSGVAGVAVSSLSLSRGGSRHRRLLTVLNDALLPQMATQAHNLKRQAIDGLSFGDFDVISGLAGIGAYLLAFLSSRREDAAAVAVIEAVLDALVALAGRYGRPAAVCRPTNEEAPPPRRSAN